MQVNRVNHWTLFAKLIESHAPLLIVRILLFWYQMQQVCIKWGKFISQYFTIACKAGCYFNDMCINHLLYADDICLLASSASAMQSLLDVYML